MEFLYCFATASLTQCVLVYLQRKLRSQLLCATVIFLNDRWILRLTLKPSIEAEQRSNCLAVLKEYGIPCQPLPLFGPVFDDLDAGDRATTVMNRRRIAIVSHGVPDPVEVQYFQKHFISGLGYCPQSLV